MIGQHIAHASHHRNRRNGRQRAVTSRGSELITPAVPQITPIPKYQISHWLLAIPIVVLAFTLLLGPAPVGALATDRLEELEI